MAHKSNFRYQYKSTLTNFTQQSPTWLFSNRPISKFPAYFLNAKIHDHVHSTPTLDPDLSLTNQTASSHLTSLKDPVYCYATFSV
jgi:hypothetical protein